MWRAGVILTLAVVLSGLVACGESDGERAEATSPVPTIPDLEVGDDALFVGELRWDGAGCVVGVVTYEGSAGDVEGSPRVSLRVQPAR